MNLHPGRLAALAALLATHAALAADVAPVSPVPTPSADAQALLRWVSGSGDNRGAPYAVLDKREARLWLYAADGSLRADTPVLLGQATGDDSVPGIGERPIGQILPHEKTTPAGRFVLEAGRNLKGEDIFWIDYDAAVSMHRMRLVDVKERRAQRMASPTPVDNRISYGCVNVPPAFYEREVRGLFAPRGGVVYVLPEVRSLNAVFGFKSDATSMTR